VYYPARKIIDKAYIKTSFIGAEATPPTCAVLGQSAPELSWYAPWKGSRMKSNPPFYKWFTASKVNIVHNALDRHIEKHRWRNNLALIWKANRATRCVHNVILRA